ncbi:TPA_asm: hypothetical protein [Pseudomonas phage vB_PaeS-D14C]|nr:TPA_asm: hypothetical protein [Pseudomonas phage vB_PaeS-D14C]
MLPDTQRLTPTKPRKTKYKPNYYKLPQTYLTCRLNQKLKQLTDQILQGMERNLPCYTL